MKKFRDVFEVNEKEAVYNISFSYIDLPSFSVLDF